MRTEFDTNRAASIASALMLFAAVSAGAQGPELPAASPKARVEQRVGLTDFAVEYSSPGVKGREIWGGLVPYDELWRTGANRSTKFEASGDFSFAGKKVSAGEYSLFTIPGEKEWTVILSSQTNLPGTRGYDDANEVARATVTAAAAPARERMTFLFSDTTDDATRLDLVWAELRISIPLGVDTGAQVQANIDEAIDSAWRPHFASARWLLDNDGDLDQALDYVNTSESIRPTWWNAWVKAQILAKQGKKAEAVASAEKAQGLGKGDDIFEGFFAQRVEDAIKGWK